MPSSSDPSTEELRRRVASPLMVRFQNTPPVVRVDRNVSGLSHESRSLLSHPFRTRSVPANSPAFPLFSVQSSRLTNHDIVSSISPPTSPNSPRTNRNRRVDDDEKSPGNLTPQASVDAQTEAAEWQREMINEVLSRRARRQDMSNEKHGLPPFISRCKGSLMRRRSFMRRINREFIELACRVGESGPLPGTSSTPASYLMVRDGIGDKECFERQKDTGKLAKAIIIILSVLLALIIIFLLGAALGMALAKLTALSQFDLPKSKVISDMEIRKNGDTTQVTVELEMVMLMYNVARLPSTIDVATLGVVWLPNTNGAPPVPTDSLGSCYYGPWVQAANSEPWADAPKLIWPELLLDVRRVVEDITEDRKIVLLAESIAYDDSPDGQLSVTDRGSGGQLKSGLSSRMMTVVLNATMEPNKEQSMLETECAKNGAVLLAMYGRRIAIASWIFNFQQLPHFSHPFAVRCSVVNSDAGA